MKRKNCAGFLAVLWTVLAMGCADPLTDRGNQENDGGALGRVLIRLSQEGRTSLPDSVRIQSYTFSFVHEDGTGIADKALETGESLKVDLRAGTWKITAAGYSAASGKKVLIAQGSTQVKVESGKEVTAEIQLKLVSVKENGIGSFRYQVEFPRELVNFAYLYLLTVQEDESLVPYTTIDLQKEGENTGLISLPAGYYRMDIKLFGDDSQAERTQAIQIYAGQETDSSINRFEAEDFQAVTTLIGAEIAAAFLGALPENTESNPYLIKVTGIDLSDAGTKGELKALYSALSRYVMLNLGGCTGGAVSKVNHDNKKHIVSLVLPETVAKIENDAFSGCTALVSVVLPEVVEIAENAFGKCEKLETVDAPKLTALTNSKVDNTNGAFYHCSSLKFVNMPQLTDIEHHSFFKTGLVSVSLPMAVEIGDSAFKTSASLVDIALPRVEFIGNSAFMECPNLTKVVLGDTPPVLGGNRVFLSGKPLDGIYVPSAALGAYNGTNLEYWTEALKAKVKAR